jgi:hypothetical protein
VCVAPQTGSGSRIFYSVKPRIVPSANNKGTFRFVCVVCFVFCVVEVSVCLCQGQIVFLWTGCRPSVAAALWTGDSFRSTTRALSPPSQSKENKFVFCFRNRCVICFCLLLYSSHLCCGRVIVQPNIRLDVIHELSTSSMSFAGMAARLRDMQRLGITTL